MMRGRMGRFGILSALLLVAAGAGLEDTTITYPEFRAELRDRLMEHKLVLVAVHFDFDNLWTIQAHEEKSPGVVHTWHVKAKRFGDQRYPKTLARELAVLVVMAFYDGLISSGAYCSQEVYGILGRSDFVRSLEESWPTT